MLKKQTGPRIDRFLYERFQRLCLTEKPRPGEAVEHLIRLAVDTGSVAEVYARTVKTGRTGQAVDDALFASRLTRLKATLELERTRLESGEVLEDDARMSDKIIEELVEIGRRSVNEELIKKFQEMITEADKIYERSEKQSADEMVNTRKKNGMSTSPAIRLDGPGSESA